MSRAAPGTGPRAAAAARAYPPLSPKELVRAAEAFEWRPQIPLKFHVGSLDAMYREGKTYLSEHNYAKAYVLLLRYSILCMDKIPTHPEAATPDGRRLLRTSMRRLKSVLPLLEAIKAWLVEARERWAAENGPLPPPPPPPAASPSGGHPAATSTPTSTFAAHDPALSWSPHAHVQLLNASENVGLAVQLANERLGGGPATTTTTTATTAAAQPEGDTDADWVSREMERVRWRLDEMARRPGDDDYDGEGGHPSSGPVPVSYHYPSVARSTPVPYESMRFGEPAAPLASEARPRPLQPLPPRRPVRPDSDSATPPPPPPPPPPVPSRGQPLASRYRDDLSLLQDSSGPWASSSSPSSSSSTTGAAPPAPPPKTREAEPATPPAKSQYTFKPAAYLENGAPIRSVFLPDTLRSRFLQIAQGNTDRGIETCGILCGKTANNALFVTCLLIPQQTGTPDSCETTGEEATLEHCSAADLIQIGWIHTHPTQTCFMSSLDLHTHAGYQMMMDESIAIVCAPKFEPSWGIFRLTNPPGLPYVGGCRKAGAFHEHALPPHELYTNARNPPGHVFVVSGIDYTVADLRK